MLIYTLHLAVLHRDTGVIQKLLKAGANPNAIDSQGRKPIEMFDQPFKPNVGTVNKDNWEN